MTCRLFFLGQCLLLLVVWLSNMHKSMPKKGIVAGPYHLFLALRNRHIIKRNWDEWLRCRGRKVSRDLLAAFVQHHVGPSDLYADSSLPTIEKDPGNTPKKTAAENGCLMDSSRPIYCSYLPTTTLAPFFIHDNIIFDLVRKLV